MALTSARRSMPSLVASPIGRIVSTRLIIILVGLVVLGGGIALIRTKSWRVLGTLLIIAGIGALAFPILFEGPVRHRIFLVGGDQTNVVIDGDPYVGPKAGRKIELHALGDEQIDVTGDVQCKIGPGNYLVLLSGARSVQLESVGYGFPGAGGHTVYADPGCHRLKPEVHMPVYGFDEAVPAAIKTPYGMPETRYKLSFLAAPSVTATAPPSVASPSAAVDLPDARAKTLVTGDAGPRGGK